MTLLPTRRYIFRNFDLCKENKFEAPKIQASASSGTPICWFLLRQLR